MMDKRQNDTPPRAEPLSFRQMLHADVRHVFCNVQEFADQHVIDGRPVSAILDEQCVGLDGGAADGLGDASALGLLRADVVLHVASGDLPRPQPEQRLVVDGRFFAVIDVAEQDGLLRISMQRAYS